MKHLMVGLGFMCVLICAAGAALAYDVNKDLQNIGAASAADISVVLAGSENVTSHFDGYSSRRFNSFATGPDGANTKLRWYNLNEPSGNNLVDPGEVVHVGWSTGDHSSNVHDMYWTDASGNRIAGSVVYNVTSDWRYETSTEHAFVKWNNIFDPGTGGQQTVTIYNVRYAVLSSPIALADLNGNNASLMAALASLPGGSSLPVPYGSTSAELQIPGTVQSASAVVLVYDLSAPGTQATTIDFIQFTPSVDVPALSGWGLALLSLLLLGTAAWMLARRQRGMARA